jgi:hypothetical protein
MMTDIVAGRYDAGIRVGNLLARDMIAVQISDDLSGYWRLRFPNRAFLPWRFALDGEVRELGSKARCLPPIPNCWDAPR